MGRPRSDQCSNGHFWTTANTKWVRPQGRTAYRVCRHCIRHRKAILRTRGTEAPRIVPEGATALAVAADPTPDTAGHRHTIFDMYSPQCPEPDPSPIPRCGYLGEMLGPWGGPGAALGER